MIVFRNRAMLWLVTLLFTITACAEDISEPEIYLIPEGFVGEFHVVYDVRTDSKPEYEGDARLFRVPDTGIVHTSLPRNYGVRAAGTIRFFQVSENGARIEITDLHRGIVEDSLENRNDKKTYIMAGGIGEFGFTLETTERGCKYIRKLLCGHISEWFGRHWS